MDKFDKTTKKINLIQTEYENKDTENREIYAVMMLINWLYTVHKWQGRTSTEVNQCIQVLRSYPEGRVRLPFVTTGPDSST